MSHAMSLVVSELNDWIRSGKARELRTGTALSQNNMARDLRVDPSTIHLWETGARRPRGANAVAYHRYLRRLAKAAEAAAR